MLGTDSNPLAPGLLIPGISTRVVSRADSAAYEHDLWALVRSFRPEGIISTVEHELPKLIALQGALAEAGVRTGCRPARPQLPRSTRPASTR
ncbi:hypothetical protein ABZV34_24705 [Streptomyces sp. NPDC005195]|uniref:hypothetical protein n=1 Tax=Streptomyces sp. NPDC005195 TaxID=3154561 RepID=UPI0033B338C7